MAQVATQIKGLEAISALVLAAIMAKEKDKLKQLESQLVAEAKDLLLEDQLKKILSEPNETERITTLVYAIREALFAKNKDGNLPPNLSELVEQAELIKEKRAREAKAKLINTPPTIHERVQLAINTAISNLPNPPTELQETITTELVLDPNSLPQITSIVIATQPPEYPQTQLTTDFSPIVNAAAELDVPTFISLTHTEDELKKTSTSQEIIESVAPALVLHRLTNPNEPQEEFNNFSHQIQANTEATTHQQVDLPSQSLTAIYSYSPPSTPQDQLVNLVASSLHTAGVYTDKAHELATYYVDSDLAKTAINISTPTVQEKTTSTGSQFTFAAVTTSFLDHIANTQHPPIKFNPNEIKRQLQSQTSTTPPPKYSSHPDITTVYTHMYNLAKYQTSSKSSNISDSELNIGPILDLLDHSQTIINDWGPEVFNRISGYFRQFVSQSEPALAGFSFGTAGAALGAAAGTTIATTSATVAPVSYLIIEKWFLEANRAAFTQAFSQGLISPFGVIAQHNLGVFAINNTSGLAWFTKFSSTLSPNAVIPTQGFLAGGFRVVSAEALMGSATSAVTTGTAIATTATTSTAVATTTGTTAAAAGAAVGNAITPFLGAAIGFAVGLVVGAVMDFINKNKEPLTAAVIGLASSVITSVMGFVTTPLQFAGVFASSAGISLAVQQQGLAQVGNTLANGIRFGVSALTSASIAIATPIIVITLTLPIVIMVFLLIINNSAYIIPTNTQGGFGPITAGPGGAYPACWPASGSFTQGPYSGGSHSSANAIDIGANAGTPVHATHDGFAIFKPSNGISANPLLPGGSICYSNNDGYGGLVIIRSSLGFSTYYAHLLGSPLTPYTETSITAGTQIGLVGSEGCSTGPHLHYELFGLSDIRNWVPAGLNPQDFSLQCFEQNKNSNPPDLPDDKE